MQFRPTLPTSLSFCALLVAALALQTPPARAVPGPAAAGSPPAKASPAGAADGDDGGGGAGAVAPYATFVKDAEVKDGLFPLIRKDGKVYLTLTKDQLDKDFYEHAVPSNGLGGYGILDGDDFQQLVEIVRFVRVDDKHVAIVLPQTRLSAPAGTPIANAVNASTADSVQAVTAIAAEDKAAGKIAIDTSFLLGDTLDLGNQLSALSPEPENPLTGYHLDPSRGYFGVDKAFPQNVVIEADETFESLKPLDAIETVTDPRSIQVRVTYNFAQVMSSPDYVPRLADDRVGYWDNPQDDFGSDDSYDDLKHFVIRWDIRASDPTKPSPAVKPIVYTLTNTIPVEYRPAIRAAVLEWNKAFARFGILDVVQVQDQPNDPNFDPDDMRYNPIRWLTDANGGGFAEAQLDWDPRTGQAFRSGILIDSDIVRGGKFYYADVVGPASGSPTSGVRGSGDTAERSIAAELWDPASLETTPPVRRRAVFAHRDSGAYQEARFGALALTLYGEEVPPAYTYDYLKAIVMHESGHDFGLQHNFIAHQAYTAKELQSKGFTDLNGVSTSVMAYDPINLWPKGAPHGAYFASTIGPYDYYAIHWGYAPVPGAHTPEDETATLSRWASAGTNPRYAFASDEDVEFDGHAVDPRIAQFILTGDGIGWCETQMGIHHSLMQTLDKRYPRPEMPWDQERHAFAMILRQYGRCALSMTHYVAGEYISRARRGDPHAPQPLTPVPRAEEQRAFGDLDRYLFSDAAWTLSPTTLRRLVYTEYAPFTSFGYDPAPRHDISLAGLVGEMQNRALLYMFSPMVLGRLADLPSKAADQHPMSLADLFTWTQDSVFADLERGNPSHSSLHHNLQRSYARVLEHLAVAPDEGTPYDAQALARYELVAIENDVGRAKRSGGLDLETRAHLEALADEIHRSLHTKDVSPIHD
jgi:hypothetical protein